MFVYALWLGHWAVGYDPRVEIPCLETWMESWLAHDHFDIYLWFESEDKGSDDDGKTQNIFICVMIESWDLG